MPEATDLQIWRYLQVYQRMLESSNLQEKAVAVISLKVGPESCPPVVHSGCISLLSSFPDTSESS